MMGQETASKSLDSQTSLICQRAQSVGSDAKRQGTNSLGREGVTARGTTPAKVN